MSPSPALAVDQLELERAAQDLSAQAPPRRCELAPGSQLDRKYRLECVIAEGGMGVIWLATQLDLERPVAIKVVRDEYANDADIVRRTLQEARAIAQLKGEHAVRVLEIARLETGAPFIVMEYLEGNDLASELSLRGPLPLDESVDLMLQACEGLAEAHALGVVHRDLKPENLFLAVQPDCSVLLKVLDFGVAKRIQPAGSRRMTLGGTTVGSPQYMAPEQMRSLPDVDQRADVWSLGTILYEMLTGIRAFDGASLTEVQRSVLRREPVRASSLRPELPAAVDRIILRCLAKDPAERYGCVQELAVDLAALGDASAAERAERTSRVATGVRRSLVEIVDRPAPPAACAAEAPRAEPTRERASGRGGLGAWLWSLALVALAGTALFTLVHDKPLPFGAPRLDRAGFHIVNAASRVAHHIGAAALIVAAEPDQVPVPEVLPIAPKSPGATSAGR